MPDTLPAARLCSCPDCTYRPLPAWIDLQPAADGPFYAQYLMPPLLMPVIQPWLDDDNPEILAVPQDLSSHIDHAYAIGTSLAAPGAKAGIVGMAGTATAAATLYLGLPQPMWSVLGIIAGILLGAGGLGVNTWYKIKLLRLAEQGKRIGD